MDPELFRVFYTFWKEMEAEARDVHLPSEVIEQLDSSECVYKLSARVKTSHGVGKIAMTQKRLFLLTDGPAGFLEITKFRDIKVTCSSALLFGLCFVNTRMNRFLMSVSAGGEDYISSFSHSHSFPSHLHLQQAGGV